MKTLATPLRPSLFSRLKGHNIPLFSLPLISRQPSLPNSLTFSSRLARPFSMAASSQSTSPTLSPGDVNNIEKDKVFQLIQAHQEKVAPPPPVEEIRTMIDQSARGLLSTFSQKHEGYPLGSMVDYACDADGSPILAMIYEHL